MFGLFSGQYSLGLRSPLILNLAPPFEAPALGFSKLCSKCSVPRIGQTHSFNTEIHSTLHCLGCFTCIVRGTEWRLPPGVRGGQKWTPPPKPAVRGSSTANWFTAPCRDAGHLSTLCQRCWLSPLPPGPLLDLLFHVRVRRQASLAQLLNESANVGHTTRS